MADFDEFEKLGGENVPAQTTEEDPAAAFLAREQDELAGIEDDNFGIDTTPAAVPADGATQETQQNDLDPLGDMTEENKPAEEPQTNGPTDIYSAISVADTRANEPEKIRVWREEQKLLLAQKDEEAMKLEVEWKDTANKEVKDWYTRRDEQGVKAKASNRAAEEAFIKERDEVTPGQEWERIARLCDFNPKNSKNLKDVTRFRSILLHLKQSGLSPTPQK
ncbi:clathrin light chain A-like [Diadema setosum]|uniref:clathrin light chain A-like n=1 Tax=Diadema setosum TaxID=31175 RepID=UPI003B3A5A95